MNTLPAIKCALILLSVCCLSACNQEKTQALQLAATTFSNEADRACKMGADSLQAAVAMPALTRSDIATSLAQAKKFGATELDLIYADNSITDSANAPALTALNQACEAHRQLAAMYTDLPRGYLLATDEVKKAQQLVVNVTARFARLGHIFAELPSTGRDNISRIRIIEARSKAMAVADEKARAALLGSVADDILLNQTNEAQSRDLILSQFAKATVLGEKLAQTSVHYDQMTVADLLESLREFSALYGTITNRAATAQSAINSINRVEANLKNDAALSPLLDTVVGQK